MTTALMLLLLMPTKQRYGQVDNPANYTISVQVQASSLVNICGTISAGSDCGYVQHLSVVIDGKHYQLNSTAYSSDILQAGAYKAKIQKEDRHGQTYQYTRIYRLIFPDGKFSDYLVVEEDQ